MTETVEALLDQTTGKEAQIEQQETTRKKHVRLARETRINFQVEANERRVRPATNREELAERLQTPEGDRVHPNTITKILKDMGYSFDGYTWGLVNAAANQQFAIDLYVNEGKDCDYISGALEKLNVLKTSGAIYQFIRKTLKLDKPVEEDLPGGTPSMHLMHNRDVPSTKGGGCGIRTGEIGGYGTSKMNVKIRRMVIALHYSDKQVLALYKDQLENNVRSDWLIARHHELYGKKTFEEVTMEFFPAIAIESNLVGV